MFPLLGKYSTRNHIDYINTSRLAQSYLQTKVESGSHRNNQQFACIIEQVNAALRGNI